MLCAHSTGGWCLRATQLPKSTMRWHSTCYQALQQRGTVATTYCQRTDQELATVGSPTNGSETQASAAGDAEAGTQRAPAVDSVAALQDPSKLKAVAVEFMAQVLFNVASCSAVAVAMESGSPPMLQLAVFHFLLLFVLVGGSRPISGGHFNPMISFVMCIYGVLPWKMLPPYVAAQLAGAALGSSLQFFMLPESLRDAAHAGVQMIPESRTIVQGFAGEFVSAFILVFVICMYGLDSKGEDDKVPVVIAITIALLLYAFAPVSSMCINPARAFGPAIASGVWDHHWVFWVAPVLGGVAAVLPYKLLSSTEESAK